MPAETKSRYQRVRRDILEKIRRKEWAAGHVLPTEMELAEQYGCARATISRALTLLAQEEIIERKRKAGSRVMRFPKKHVRVAVEPVGSEITTLGAEYRYRQISRTFGDAPDWILAQTGIHNCKEILHLNCLHFADEEPFQFEECWINATALPQAVEQDFKSIDPDSWLLSETPLCDGEMTLSITFADELLVNHLDFALKEPVFTRDCRTAQDGVTLAFFRKRFRRGYSLRGSF